MTHTRFQQPFHHNVVADRTHALCVPGDCSCLHPSHPPRSHRSPRRAISIVAGFVTLASLLGGCNDNKDVLSAPQVLISPYDSSRGEAMWAVVPLANESGVSEVDTYMISDKVVMQVDEVRGIACLPLNRTIGAMRARGMDAVRTPEDARLLASTLGVDGLLIGTITAYDPYDPPKLGMAMALFVRPREATPGVDPMRLGQAYSDERVRVQSAYDSRPVATVSEQYDGRSHDTLMDLKTYAQGRHDPASASGWRGVLSNMDRFCEFAAYSTISRLIDQENLRVAMLTLPPESSATGDGSASGEHGRTAEPTRP